jgi:addiction module HigA family antidote
MNIKFDREYLSELHYLGKCTSKKYRFQYTPTLPGEILKEEIEFRGIFQKELARPMGVSYPMLNEILNCKRPVTAAIAMLFEASLGLDAETFVNMQARYNMPMARKDKKMIARFNKVRKACISAS